MSNLYERIEELCKTRGMTIGSMCRELEISRGNFSDLKAGRVKTLGSDKLSRISEYFGVSVDNLLGKEPAAGGGLTVSDEDIKFALFGGDSEEITDEMFQEVKNFAAYIKQREKEKNEKGQ